MNGDKGKILVSISVKFYKEIQEIGGVEVNKLRSDKNGKEGFTYMLAVDVNYLLESVSGFWGEFGLGQIGFSDILQYI